MLKLKKLFKQLKKARIDLNYVQEDLRKAGLLVMGVGWAGLILGSYPGHGPLFFAGVTMVGLIVWFFGVLKRGDSNDSY